MDSFNPCHLDMINDDTETNPNIDQAEARAEFAERSVQKLQKEVDRLEGNI